MDVSALDRPVQREHRVEYGDRTRSRFDFRRVGDRLAALHQRDRLLVDRQAVPGGTVDRGEGFQLVERARILEDMGEAAQRVGGSKAAGAAAGAFLQRIGMGCRIRAEEKAGIARGRGLDQRHAMALALGDGRQ